MVWIGVKNANMQVTYFLNSPILNLFVFCFFVILFYIGKKWLLMRNVATILPLNSKLPGNFNFLMLQIEVSKCLKIVEFSKISIKIKNCKTFCKPQTANRLKKFNLSFPIPPSTRWNLTTSRKQFLLRRCIEIYRHLLSKCFKNAFLGSQEMV